ncbi:unnamed protein product [Merluccius merluccius]
MEVTVDYCVDLVLQKDLGRRLQAGPELAELLLDPERVPALDREPALLDRMVDGVASSWVNNSHFKVVLLGMDILSALVTRLQERFRNQVGTVLPSLMDRLGDAKDPVREQDQALLLKIMDQAANPQYVWERMLGGFKHKNSRTREGLCLCLIATLNAFGSQSLTLSKIVPHICNLLGDPTSQVRDGAMNCLVEIYRHVGERVRMDLGKKGLPQSRLNVIFSRFDEVQRSGDTVPSPAPGESSATDHMRHRDTRSRLVVERAVAVLSRVLYRGVAVAASWRCHGRVVAAAAASADADEAADVQMAAVDCGEWTDLCAARPTSPERPYPFRPITAFPAVLLLRPHEAAARRYRGMLGSEALHRFILTSAAPAPALLSTQEEVRFFLQEGPGADPSDRGPHRVLGLFETAADPSKRNDVPVPPPAVLLYRAPGGPPHPPTLLSPPHPPTLLSPPSPPTLLSPPRPPTLLSPPPASAPELVALVHDALLQEMPELTVENLPSYLGLGRPLLLLFVGEEDEEDEWGRRETRAALQEVRAAAQRGREGERGGDGGADRYLPCWIHLRRTPAGVAVLRSFLGSLPPLPALVLTRRPGGALYHYPPHGPMAASALRRWLRRVEDGSEPPTGSMVADRWAPVVPFYDFLSFMDQEAPEYARPSASRSKTGERERKGRGRREGGGGGEGEAEGGGEAHSSPSPVHSEL